MNFVKPQKVSTHSAHSDICYLHFFSWLSDWVEILRGFTKFIFKQMLKVSASYIEKQKSFIPKKNISLAVVNIKTKKLCLLTQFSGKVLNVAPTIQLLSSPQVYFSPNYAIFDSFQFHLFTIFSFTLTFTFWSMSNLFYSGGISQLFSIPNCKKKSNL